MNSVLVVDDDRRICEVLTRWLAAAGRVVVACQTFEEAKRYLASHSPDVLVTDLRLDQYNGLHLVVWLKHKVPSVSCVVVTGHDDPVLRRVAETMHARYLLKPLRREELLAAIETVH